MEAAVTTREDSDGDTPRAAQVYLNEKVTMIQPEDSVTHKEYKEIQMKSDGSNVTEQILQFTLEIIYLLTGENYVVVKKTPEDHVTSIQSSIEELHPPAFIFERNEKKLLEVINKIIELITGEVGDVSVNVHSCGEDLSDGDPSSFDSSEARSLTLFPTTEVSNSFVTQCSKLVDKKRPSIDCKSQANTMVEGASKRVCRISALTNKQTDAASAQSGDDLNSCQGGQPRAMNGFQTEILLYDTNMLNNQTAVSKINTTVKDVNKTLSNLSGRSRHVNPSEAPKTLGSSSQQIHSEEKWACAECRKMFNCKSRLTKHRQIHKEKLCNSSKSSKTFSDGHQAEHCDQMSFVDYGKKNNCESHISGPQRTSNEERVCSSSESIKTFFGTSDVLECGDHQAGKYQVVEHQVDNLEGCLDCGNNLTCSSGLGGHQIVNQENDTACLDCGNNLSYKSHLVRHRKVHSDEKLFLCSECGKRFSLKSALLRHQMIHTGEKPFACSICGKRFNQRSHYIRHQLSHSDKKPFTCPDCGKSFIQKSDVAKHQKGHKGKKLSCLVCWKEFCSKTPLAKHQKSHGEFNRASCLECGKCFSQKSALVVHQRIHTGEKPFSCDDCGKLFNRKSLLVRHRRVHTGEKPFSCRECGKSFTRTTNLVIHQRTHSGEKPYSCSKCSKSFNSNTTLLKHQRIHGADLEVL